MSERDEPGTDVRQALEAWAPLAPPPDFAERVLAARDAERTVPRVAARGAVAALVARRGRSRGPLAAAVLATTAVAAAAAGAFVATRTRPPAPAPVVHQAATGALARLPYRTTEALGDRGLVVAEHDSQLSWRVDPAGAAAVEQRAGDVFYRVEPGGPFVVTTPAGTVRVTGTCFRIQIHTTSEDPMPLSKSSQLLVSGALGAALATAVVVTVYEGHVIADTRRGSTALAAGTRATLDARSGEVVAATGGSAAGTAAAARAAIGSAGPAPLDESTATREQAIAFATQQRLENDRLRARVAALESAGAAGGASDDESHDGRPWHDPSPETLKEWAKECRIQADEPGFDRWSPQTSLGRNGRGLEPAELAKYNEALAEVQAQWKTFVRALYIEATGDTAGADALSIDAMRNEIMQKSNDDGSLVQQRIANEKAGLAPPPADLARLSAAERLMREYVTLGDKTEAAIARRLGPERASAIRGDGWDSRSRMAGCPSE